MTYMTKKIITIWIALVLVLAAFPVSAFSAESVEEVWSETVDTSCDGEIDAGQADSSAESTAEQEDGGADSEIETPDEPTGSGAEQLIESAAEEVVSYPAFRTEVIDTGSVRVFIDVPEGAFPKNTSLRSYPVAEHSVKDAVEDAIGGAEAGEISAVDISFFNEDSAQELEPQVPVSVHVEAYGIDSDRYRVVHIDDSGEAGVVADSDDESFSFTADSFSIYAVVGEKDGVVRRTYNFYDGETLVDSQIVRNGDLLLEPSVPAREELEFVGWSADEGQTFQSFEEPISDIDESASEDEVVDLYAHFVRTVSVTFHDTSGRVIEVRTGMTGEAVSVDDVTFEVMADEYVSGWTTSEDMSSEGKVEGSVTLGDKDIDLYPLVEGVCWVIFHTNDTDSDPAMASTIEPYYVEIGQKAQRPTDPTRPGYAFKEWTTDQAGTEPFSFETPLQDHIVLYAQWTPGDSSYQVLVWQETLVNEQYVEGNYTLSDHYTFTEASGTEVSLTDEDELITGLIASAPYKHHELARIDGPVTVNGDGTTVLNVYFDLRVYAVEFQAMTEKFIRSGRVRAQGGVLRYDDAAISYAHWYGNAYGNVTFSFTVGGKTYTDYDVYRIEARYGENIADRWPDQYTAEWSLTENAAQSFIDRLEAIRDLFYPSTWTTNEANRYTGGVNESLTKMTHLTESLMNNDGSDTHHMFIKFIINSSPVTINYWLENVEDDEFTRSDMYSCEVKTELHKIRAKALDGFTYLGSYNEPYIPDGYPGYDLDEETGIEYNNFYYSRNRYPLTFYNYNQVEKEYKGDDAVKYEAPLASYDHTPPRPSVLPDAYEFRGWYTTEQCISGTEYTFDEDAKMPLSSLTLYAKWAPRDYTVTFRPNGGTPVDPQTVPYGKNAVVPETPEREGFTFAGWMKGSAPFNFETQITEDITLTAKWLEDASIYVIYDAGDHGDGAPEDPNPYMDVTNARAKGTPSSVEEGYRFLGWEKGEELVRPGELFEVLSSDAEKVSADRYEITLKAVYGEDLPELTVKYMRNLPSEEGGDKASAKTGSMKRNTAFTASEVDELDFGDEAHKSGRWKFIGWNTEADGSGTAYDPGTELAAGLDGDNILYGQWEEITHVITYDPNGGELEGQEEPLKITYGHGEVISIYDAPVREGWTFLYWRGSEYQPGDSYTVTEDHTFTAQWEEEEPSPSPKPSPEPTGSPDPTPQTPSTSTGVPKTGESTSALFWLVLMLAALTGMGALAVTRRKRTSERR